MMVKLSDHPLQVCYRGMKRRCYSPDAENYPRYGGRGITVCDSWLDDKWLFIAWAYEKLSSQGLVTEDLGRTGYTLDRIDNDGPYAPWNCEWITMKAQVEKQAQTFLVTAFGETKTLNDWQEDPRASVSRDAIKSRILAGMSSEESITTPRRDGGQGTPITAFGETKSATDWSKDPRCSVTSRTILNRVKSGQDAETSISLGTTLGPTRRAA